MLYWLIPYLVAYNASDTGNWKYGPKNLFKVDVRGDMVDGNDSMRSDAKIFISCRPVNSSSILCHVDSATVDNYDLLMRPNGNIMKEESHRHFAELSNVTFQIEFDKMGPRYVTLLNINPAEYAPFREKIIRAIANQFNIGTDLSQMKLEKENIIEERSVNSICETSFDVRKTKLPFEEEEPSAIVGFNFDLSPFPERVGNESIIIEKNRKINACSVKPNYFYVFNSVGNNIIRSKSFIYLGKNGFSSYSENVGTLQVNNFETASKVHSLNEMEECEIRETIRLKLVGIQPATKKL